MKARLVRSDLQSWICPFFFFFLVNPPPQPLPLDLRSLAGREKLNLYIYIYKGRLMCAAMKINIIKTLMVQDLCYKVATDILMSGLFGSETKPTQYLVYKT